MSKLSEAKKRIAKEIQRETRRNVDGTVYALIRWPRPDNAPATVAVVQLLAEGKRSITVKWEGSTCNEFTRIMDKRVLMATWEDDCPTETQGPADWEYALKKLVE